ncbi:M16 family metallopeptidase [Desulfovibrio litoralis]|uniref:Zinc protease n=1 Tax=Desulfovibrio litoralis DSM 11393 TaxID=1121455 RepID=A0A1M7TDH0_9BACT|nr:pitrilysin family protein [Desulfovibrio litoralis]SHN68799.1 zinc protease [Desulfovibrio litoralis DSM 11393]
MTLKTLLFTICCSLVIISSTYYKSVASETNSTSNNSTIEKNMPLNTEKQNIENQSPYSITRLSNGLKVAVFEDMRFPLVSIRLYVHAGSAYENETQAGISHLLEHMVFKGTDNFPKGQISSSIESVGGYLNAATSFDYTVYQTDMPQKSWLEGLKAVQEMAFKATLDPNELEPEKDVIIAELKRSEDNPGAKLFKMMQKATFNQTSYARPIIGYEQTVRSTSSDDLKTYIKTHYQPQNMLLLVAGNVKKEDVIKEAEALFGSLENTSKLSPPELTPPNAKAGIEVVYGPWNKIYLAFSFPAPPQTDPQATALDVFAHLLSGDRTSYLYKKYKYDLRLVESISASYDGFERTGMLSFFVTLEPDKFDKFWTTFIKDLPQLANLKFTDQELARAKLNIEDDLFRSKETLAGLASKLGYFEFFSSGGETGEKTYLHDLNIITQKVLAQVASEVLKPEVMNIAMIVPEVKPETKSESKSEVKPETQAQAKTEITKEPKQKNVSNSKQSSLFADLNSLQTKMSQDLNSNWQSKNKTQTVDETIQVEQAELIDLGANRKLILITDNTMPYTAINLFFNGGDSLLSQKEQGLAAFVSQAILKGTKTMDVTAIETFKADRAASFGASSGRQSFTLSLSQPSRFTPDMLKLLKDTLENPTFKEQELARIKENQIASVKTQEDQALGLAFRRVFPFLYGEHDYGKMQLGTLDSIEKIKRKDVLNFWNKQKEQAWVLSVSGAFNRDEIIAFAKSLPKPTQAIPSLKTAHFVGDKELNLKMPGRNQAHLLLIFETDKYISNDTPALELLNAVLAGQSGLLFRDLRDNQGLGYTVTSMTWQAQQGGFIAFYIGTEPNKIAQAKDGFIKIIQTLKDTKLDETELQRGKNQLEGDYYRDHQSIASRSSEAGSMALFDYKIDHPRQNIEQAKSVQAQDLQNLARKYFDLEKMRIVKVLP